MKVGCDLKSLDVAKEAFYIAGNKITGACRTVLLHAAKPEFIPKVPLPYIKLFYGPYTMPIKTFF